MKKSYVWIQRTYVNGERKYEPKTRTEGKMMQLFAQMHFLKQAGEDIELDIVDHDEMWAATIYQMTRKSAGGKRVIVHTYTRTEVEQDVEATITLHDAEDGVAIKYNGKVVLDGLTLEELDRVQLGGLRDIYLELDDEEVE